MFFLKKLFISIFVYIYIYSLLYAHWQVWRTSRICPEWRDHGRNIFCREVKEHIEYVDFSWVCWVDIWAIFSLRKHHGSEQFQDDCFPAGILGHSSLPLLQLQYTALRKYLQTSLSHLFTLHVWWNFYFIQVNSWKKSWIFGVIVAPKCPKHQFIVTIYHCFKLPSARMKHLED